MWPVLTCHSLATTPSYNAHIVPRNVYKLSTFLPPWGKDCSICFFFLLWNKMLRNHHTRSGVLKSRTRSQNSSTRLQYSTQNKVVEEQRLASCRPFVNKWWWLNPDTVDASYGKHHADASHDKRRILTVKQKVVHHVRRTKRQIQIKSGGNFLSRTGL